MTDKIDTSTDAIEALLSFIRHNKVWEGLQEADVEAYEEAESVIIALATERDAATLRAGKAEAREKVLVEALRKISREYGPNHLSKFCLNVSETALAAWEKDNE